MDGWAGGPQVAAGRSRSDPVTLALPEWRARAVSALLAVVAAALAAVLIEGSSPIKPAPVAGPSPQHTRSALGIAAPLSAALGAADPAYRITLTHDVLGASNPAQHLHVHFARGGVQLSSGRARFGLSLGAAGFGTSLRALAEVAPRANANRVRYLHGGLAEWFVNGPLGIEQGFSIGRAPPGDRSGSLRLAMTPSGDVRASLDAAGRSIVMRSGGRSLRYGGLLATDARGRRLPSRLELSAGRIVLSVDARGAHYPLSIDPLIQGSELSGGEGADELFGRSVALSADGNTAIIGASGKEAVGVAGAAWVLTRSGTTWQQQGGALTGAGEAGGGHFGRGVALSANGNTALVGASLDEEGKGAAWVFTRSGTSWTQQGPKLTDAGKGTAKGRFGRSVALSADGNTALIGSPLARGGRGAAWIYTRSGTSWSQQGEWLVDAEQDVGAHLGVSVALSGDGATALLGGPTDELGVGAAWVFTLSGSTWQQAGGKLTGSGEIGDGRFAYSVALSGDGSTAMIGGPYDDGMRGAEWAFSGSGGAFSQQGAKLAGDENGGESKFGYATSLSADGNTALIGAPRYARHLGSASLLSRSGATWTQPGEGLKGANATPPAGFGSSVALSADGGVALVGAPRNNKKDGAVWSFIGAAATPLPEPSPETTSPGVPGASGAPANALARAGVLASETSALPLPVLGKTANLLPISGRVLVKLPGASSFVLLADAEQVPFGTIIDARLGRVAVVTARLHGGTQRMTFFGGEFRITQRRNGLVVATLAGGDFSVCPTARERAHRAQASSAHASGKHVVRKLWAEGHGSYSTKGNYASGAVLGTRWLTEDRCDGTLIHVATDRVAVTNLVNHRHVKVKAGHSYLARAR